MLTNKTYTVEFEDMRQFADIARARNTNSSELLRKIIGAWLKRECRKQSALKAEQEAQP